MTKRLLTVTARRCACRRVLPSRGSRGQPFRRCSRRPSPPGRDATPTNSFGERWPSLPLAGAAAWVADAAEAIALLRDPARGKGMRCDGDTARHRERQPGDTARAVLPGHAPSCRATRARSEPRPATACEADARLSSDGRRSRRTQLSLGASSPVTTYAIPSQATRIVNGDR